MKLVTLNIYGGIYLDKSIAHLKEIKPDVLCLQELMEQDVPALQKALGMPYHTYSPGMRVAGENSFGFREGNWGMGILSRTPLHNEQIDYYNKISEETPVFDGKPGNSRNRALLSAVVDTGDGKVRVGTTHFTWTPKGDPNEEQRRDAAKLTEIVRKQNVDILCGDFNAPRGAEIMMHISSHMDDHMPDGVETTIDQELHRTRGIKLVVDNVFTRRGLAQVSLSVQGGMSDHKALIANFIFNSARRNQGEHLPDVPSLRPVVGPADLSQAPAKNQQVVP